MWESNRFLSDRKSVRTSKNVLYENPYCVIGAVKLTGSEQTPTGKCTDRIIGTRKGAELSKTICG